MGFSCLLSSFIFIRKHLFLFMLYLVQICFAQSTVKDKSIGTYSDFRFNQINTYQGLSQSSVLSVCQDKYGFVWMGTKDGLNRFDGYTFNVFKNELGNTNSLSNNEVIILSTDSKGDILIGTRGGGLNKYVYKENHFVQPENVLSPNSTVQSIYFENDSVVWIGSTSGLFRGVVSDSNEFGYKFSNKITNSIYYDGSGNVIPHIKHHVSIVSINQLSENKFVVGTEKGVFLFYVNEGVFRRIPMGAIDSSKVNSVIKRSNSDIVFGTSEGIYITHWNGEKFKIIQSYNSNQINKFKINFNWINELMLDSDGNIWGGSRGGGFLKIDSDNKLSKFHTNTFIENELTDNVINSLMIDNTGVLWLGTESQGCYQLDLHRKKIQHFNTHPEYGNMLNSVLITALCGDKGNRIFAGTAYNGINEITLNNTNNTYQLKQVQTKGLLDSENNEIISLYYDSKNNLWVGSARNYITKIDAYNNVENYNTEGFVFSIFEDSNGNIWFGTWGNGLGRIDQTTDKVSFFNKKFDNYQSLSSDKVLSLLEDKQGNLWIGTKGGGVNVTPIRSLKQGMGSFASYKNNADNHPNSLSHNDVYCIFQDSKDDIWIGTGNGLNKVVFPKDENLSEAILKNKIEFETFTESEGLPNNVIYGILEDDDQNLWISTVNGLAKMNLNDLSFTRYGVYDGLNNNEFHSNSTFKDEKGNMYFGGIHGISFFHPSSIKPNPYEAFVFITGLKVNNKYVLPEEESSERAILKKSISATNEITLLPRHKDFTIEFSAIHFSNIKNVRYKYRLLGFNDEWRLTGDNDHTAKYTNINEGYYTFQVKATNNDGKWSDQTAELLIRIKPPFWRSPFFMLLYISMFITLLFFFRKYSIIGVSEKNKLKLEAIEKKQAIELTEAKMRFFTNISHEIRTPLTLIYGPLEEVIKNSNLDELARSSLSLIKKNVDRLLNLTNQLIQLRKIDIGLVEPQYEKIRISSYMADVLEYFEQQFKEKGISLNYSNEIEEDSDEAFFDRQMITTSLFNLISNAIKYTPSEGSIEIKIFESSSSDINKEVRKKKARALVEKYINIEISDNGIGIPIKELRNVFKRFYQASSNQSAEQPGSGIGLSIVKEYIELHKGIVTVMSQPGKGTKFLIQIPKNANISGADIVNSKPTKEILIEEKDHDDNKTDSKFGKGTYEFDKDDSRPRILIAEDDKDFAEYLYRSLQNKYQIILAINGKQAWSLIQKYKPDLIISDIMMPEMNGNELCSRIKAKEELCHIPIIILSAHAANEDIIEGYEHGADRYISKPFAIELLNAQINQLLNTRQKLVDLYSRKVLLKPREITITSSDEKFLSKIMELIEDNISQTDFDIGSIVEKMNMSHSTVLKRTKALSGFPLVEFVRRYKLNKAAMIFEKEKLPVSEVAFMTGFSDPKYFSKCFTKQFEMTPSKYISNFHGK